MLALATLLVVAVIVVSGLVSAAASTRRAYGGSMYANLGRR